MRLRILFLDFDGVLNSRSFSEYKATNPKDLKTQWQLAASYWSEGDMKSVRQIDGRAVQVLNQIVKQARCQVVVSSAWRLDCSVPLLERLLRYHGLETGVMGATTGRDLVEEHQEHNEWSRGLQIDAYLQMLPAGIVESFVILDDSSDMKPHLERLYRTDSAVGLRPEDAEPIVAMFG